MSNSTGHSPVERKSARLPVCLAFLAAPLVWATLYWVFQLPAGTLLQTLSGSFSTAGSGNEQQTGFSDLSVSAGVGWLLLQAVLLYPILEEIIFRGALQGWLLGRPSLGKGRVQYRFDRWVSIPNLLASLVFTAFHFINQPPLWAAMVFIPSLVFGWAREHTGGLLLPILLHIWYNAGFYFLFVRF